MPTDRAVRRRWLPLVVTTIVPATIALTPLPSSAASGSTVAADGSGTYKTVQAAVDAVPAGNSKPFKISIKKGTYRENVVVPSNKPFITLQGMGSNARDVLIVNNRPASQYGAASATVTVNGPDFTATNLTISNDFDENTEPGNAHQALALNITATRCVLDSVRALGNQDTLWINRGARVYAHAIYVEGDVDFVYGRGTAVFHASEIHSVTRPPSAPNNGYITAAATAGDQTYGFLFYKSKVTSGAAANTTYLGRPWHPGGDVNAKPQVVYRESMLGAHIRSVDPWTDMGGFSWKTARFFEYKNTGPGAGTGASRPQLSDSQAKDFTPQKYLAGSDGWNPIR